MHIGDPGPQHEKAPSKFGQYVKGMTKSGFNARIFLRKKNALDHNTQRFKWNPTIKSSEMHSIFSLFNCLSKIPDRPIPIMIGRPKPSFFINRANNTACFSAPPNVSEGIIKQMVGILFDFIRALGLCFLLWQNPPAPYPPPNMPHGQVLII